MIRQITLGEQEYSYTLRKSARAKRMRIAVYGDATFAVTIPRRLNTTFAEKFIIQQSRWIIDKVAHLKSLPGFVIPANSKRDFMKYKEAALSFAQNRVAYFNEIYKLQVNKINIKNQKTRWGSCSRKGNLNFNYKIVLLPPNAVDYIIVHELCHLAEFNHSPRFWNLVAKIIPNYREIRRGLRHGLKA